jgi:hypothetical protein
MEYTPLQDWLRRLRNPLAGLRFWVPTSDGRHLIATRHYPHLLCWSWSISARRINPASGTHHAGGVHLSRHNSGGHLVLHWIWIDWQNYRMPALRAVQRQELVQSADEFKRCDDCWPTLRQACIEFKRCGLETFRRKAK